MRRFIRGMAIAAIAACWPALAAANDQETSQEIAASLRSSGQLVDYSIGVKFQDGTALLQGRVASEQQRGAARALVQQMNGVTNVVDRLEIKATRGPESAAGPGVRFSGDEAPQTPAAPQASHTVRQEPAQQPASQGFSLANLLGGPATPPAVRPASAEVPTQSQPRSYNDPGDPLKQSQSARFAPSNSRRFMAEPNYTVAAKQPAPKPTAKNSTGEKTIQQVSQLEPAAGPAMVPPQGSPMQFGTAAPGAYRLAGTAPVGQVPANPAAYHHARAVGPMYGPAMGGCTGGACSGAAYEQPNMPGYAWPSYAAYPNYGAVTYPRQYSPTAWPYIGPFYPYPQVPLGWRKVSLEWDDGWWWLDFHDHHLHH